ncbi:MAG: SIMPL domain-containing protein [Candidatus Woesearchaeota archaeon]
MKNINWINFGLLLVLLVLSALMLTNGNILERNDRTLELSDTAMTEVDYDEVTVNLRIVTRNESHEFAVNENTEINNRIVEHFEDNYEVETTNYRISEWTERDIETRNVETLGYEVYNTISIKSEDVEDAGSITSEAFDLGAYEIQSVNYGLTDESKREIQNELMNEAITSLKDRAESISDASGVKIVGIKSITPDNWNYAPMTMRNDAYMEEMSSDSDYKEPTFSPGKREVSSSVTITFEIR